MVYRSSIQSTQTGPIQEKQQEEMDRLHASNSQFKSTPSAQASQKISSRAPYKREEAEGAKSIANNDIQVNPRSKKHLKHNTPYIHHSPQENTETR